ncbi:hypothetical protein PtB15_9B644 [Puccinia triticina]|nr:hypothetical protein PtB15_9B644 [Puccinia triticina]
MADPVIGGVIHSMADPVIGGVIHSMADPVIGGVIHLMANPVIGGVIHLMANPVIGGVIHLMANPVIEWSVCVHSMIRSGHRLSSMSGSGDPLDDPKVIEWGMYPPDDRVYDKYIHDGQS